jgi:hypothetical protein
MHLTFFVASTGPMLATAIYLRLHCEKAMMPKNMKRDKRNLAQTHLVIIETDQ